MMSIYIISRSHTFQELKKWKTPNWFCYWYNFPLLMSDCHVIV